MVMFKSDKFRIVVKLILVVCLLVFAQILFFPEFIYDDIFHETRAAEISSFTALLSSKIPVFFVFWKTIAFISGDGNVFWFRLSHVLLHTLNAAIVFLITQEIFSKKYKRDDVFFSFLCALCFAIHPMQVESVAWLSSLKGVLASTFTLMAFYLYQSDNFKNLRFRNVYIVATFVLSLLTKPTNLLFPLVFMVYDYAILEFKIEKVFKKSFILIIIALAGALLTILEFPQATPFAKDFQWGERTIYMMHSMGFYLKKFFYPYPLLFDYGQNEKAIAEFIKTDINFYRKTILLFTGFISLLSYLFISNIRPLATLGLVIFFVSIFPVLGFIPHNFEAISLVADRFMYLGVWGLAICLFDIGQMLCEKEFLQKVSRVVVSLVFICLISLSFLQARRWRSSSEILQYNVVYNPKSLSVLEGLALSQYKEGNYEEAYETAGQGLRQSDGLSLYEIMINSLAKLRSYNLLEVFESSMLKQKRLTDLRLQALIDFQLFRYEKLLQKKEQKVVETPLEQANRVFSKTNETFDKAKETKLYIEDLIQRYPIERDKEVMESYFYTAQYFMGLDHCEEFKYFREQMEDYRKKRSYVGSINLDYDWLKCKKVLEAKQSKDPGRKKS